MGHLEEADVVRMIYRLFLEGFSPNAIGSILEGQNIPAPAGGERRSDSTILSILGNEMFYGRSWQDVSIDEFIKILDDYMHWYAEERIKISLGGLSPIQYRRQLGLTA